jgi:hypothetical protein
MGVFLAALPPPRLCPSSFTNSLLHQFNDASLGAPNDNRLVDISGFIFDDFRIASFHGASCKAFPAESTKRFTGPHMGMLEGLVGGMIQKELQLKTSPEGVFQAGGWEWEPDSEVFDIIDLPVCCFASFISPDLFFFHESSCSSRFPFVPNLSPLPLLNDYTSTEPKGREKDMTDNGDSWHVRRGEINMFNESQDSGKTADEIRMGITKQVKGEGKKDKG